MYKFVVILSVCVLSVVTQNLYTKEVFRRFFLDCEGLPLEKKVTIPSLPTLFYSVILTNCTPPDKPYVELLRAHNVIIGDEFELRDVSAESHFGENLLSDLPNTLKVLTIRGAGGMLHLEKDALSRLPKITTLKLYHVRADEIPTSLETLHFSFSDITEIPEELDVKSLMVVTKQPIFIVGTMPRLQVLTLHAPVSCFLACSNKQIPLITPSLDVIQLGEYFPMPDEAEMPIPRAYSSIRGLVLSGVQWSEVPSQLLIGGENMEYFYANDNRFTTLPEVLFSDTCNMVLIDLSNNRLGFLPRNIFYWVTKLQTLKLQSNLLSAYVLAAIAPLKSLKNLHLDDNPLGDLCESGSWLLLNLQNLDLLTLRETNASRICKDWIQQLPNLTELRLESNNIGSIACSDLRGPVMKEWPTLYIFLDDNPIDHADCSKDNFELDSTISVELKKLHLQMSPTLRCDNGSYWLSRWLQLKVYVTITHIASIEEECGDEWIANKADVNAFFEVDCACASLDQTLRGPSAPTRFGTVSLKRCPPPKSFSSYADVLKRHNITIGEEFHLYSVPIWSHFGKHHLSGLPNSLKALRISGAGGLLRLKTGALSLLPRIKDLTLQLVHTDEIPDYLDSLGLAYTGQAWIHESALNVKSLMVVSETAVDISGVMPYLQVLSLYAPVRNLFGRDMYEIGLRAHKLEVLKLGKKFPELPADAMGLPQVFRSMRGLELTLMDWSELPNNLLRGGLKMRYITAKHNNFTTLPDDLFSATPNMDSIDFSKNRIEYLPSHLFVGLKNLTVLNLASNLLTVNVMEAIAPLTSLRELYLDENPLGDFCGKGGIILNQKKLLVLSIEYVNASRFCAKWLLELPNTMMHLRENDYIKLNACSNYSGDILHECTAVYSRPLPL